MHSLTPRGWIQGLAPLSHELQLWFWNMPLRVISGPIALCWRASAIAVVAALTAALAAPSAADLSGPLAAISEALAAILAASAANRQASIVLYIVVGLCVRYGSGH